MPTGGAPPDCPWVHTPSNRATVPYGQLAEAGEATASDPKTVANMQQPTRIEHFTVQTLVARADDYLSG